MTIVVAILLLLGILLLYITLSGPKLPPETDAIIDGVLESELPQIIVGETGFAASDGLNIWYENIAPEGSPQGTVLLIMGNGADALIWPPAFVQAFVAADYQTIRYDHRSTGMSDWMTDWDRKNPYAVVDMAGDAVAVLDALGIGEAHLIGLSLGGMIAQEVAIHYPDRVASLTLMMTSGFIGDPELPGLSSRYVFESAVKGIPLLKYRLMGGERNLIKERIAKQIVALGYDGLDIKELAELVLYDLRERRGINLRGALQHQTAVTISGSRYAGLSTLNIPTLIVHGTADPIIPVAHGRKLVEQIPGAKGLWLEGVGHVFPVPGTRALLENIIAHLSLAKTV
jgi:pimeloyl-ACP methyl ester carboxylesterase